MIQLTGVYLTGVHAMGVHPIGICLTGLHLTGMHLMGVHRIGMYPISVYPVGAYPIGVDVTGTYFKGVHLLVRSASYRRASHRRASHGRGPLGPKLLPGPHPGISLCWVACGGVSWWPRMVPIKSCHHQRYRIQSSTAWYLILACQERYQGKSRANSFLSFCCLSPMEMHRELSWKKGDHCIFSRHPSDNYDGNEVFPTAINWLRIVPHSLRLLAWPSPICP